MKFKKDNSANQLTAEILQQKRLAEQAIAKTKADGLEKERERIEQYERDVLPLRNRVAAYPSAGEQLDMLWHDIDEGRISADKTSPDSWYARVKQIKLETPLS
jgi:hypothetical protein